MEPQSDLSFKEESVLLEKFMFMVKQLVWAKKEQEANTKELEHWWLKKQNEFLK